MTLSVARMGEHTATHVRRGRTMSGARDSAPVDKEFSALQYTTPCVARTGKHTATHVRLGKAMFSVQGSALVNQVIQYQSRPFWTFLDY